MPALIWLSVRVGVITSGSSFTSTIAGLPLARARSKAGAPIIASSRTVRQAGNRMRYVIVIAAVTFFILWQVIYDDWRTTEAIIAEITRLWRMTGF